jgi:hypothetical protein
MTCAGVQAETAVLSKPKVEPWIATRSPMRPR